MEKKKLNDLVATRKKLKKMLQKIFMKSIKKIANKFTVNFTLKTACKSLYCDAIINHTTFISSALSL
jgi:hypothetical protein